MTLFEVTIELGTYKLLLYVLVVCVKILVFIFVLGQICQTFQPLPLLQARIYMQSKINQQHPITKESNESQDIILFRIHSEMNLKISTETTKKYTQLKHLIAKNISIVLYIIVFTWVYLCRHVHNYDEKNTTLFRTLRQTLMSNQKEKPECTTVGT